MPPRRIRRRKDRVLLRIRRRRAMERGPFWAAELRILGHFADLAGLEDGWLGFPQDGRPRLLIAEPVLG